MLLANYITILWCVGLLFFRLYIAEISYFPWLFYIIEMALEVNESQNGKRDIYIYTPQTHTSAHTQQFKQFRSLLSLFVKWRFGPGDLWMASSSHAPGIFTELKDVSSRKARRVDFLLITFLKNIYIHYFIVPTAILSSRNIRLIASFYRREIWGQEVNSFPSLISQNLIPSFFFFLRFFDVDHFLKVFVEFITMLLL